MAVLDLTNQSVSVVLPVRNEAARIGSCIEGILAQTVPVHEIVVVDSGSTDGTLAILARFPEVRVVRIAPDAFNHGDSRNLGASVATGEWVVFTVGDARPYDSQWIEELLASAVDDEVSAVGGVQVVPHEREANPLDWYRPVSRPGTRRVKYRTPEEFDALAPAEKITECGWDNVSAAYRRDVLLEIPFQRVNYCEDAIWARDALRAGKTIAYNTGARVYHYHVETPDYAFRRAIAVMYYRYRAFNYVYDAHALVLPVLRDTARIALASGPGVGEKAHWMLQAPRLRLARSRARDEFVRALEGGDAQLDAVFSRYCETAPIPVKSKA